VMASCALLSFVVLLLGRKVIYKVNIESVQEESAEMMITS
jgi:hypothetical protein